jgi:Asp-tRNA(Asn)/Glu-tRNA(Gln) amidotransferase A subunit family amidase
MPLGLAKDNLPVGIEIDGIPGSDLKILSIGLALEEILQ